MSAQPTPTKISTRESTAVTLLLIAAALGYLLLFLGLPLFAVFYQALSKGWALYWKALQEPDAWSAIKLTLLVAAIAPRQFWVAPQLRCGVAGRAYEYAGLAPNGPWAPRLPAAR